MTFYADNKAVYLQWKIFKLAKVQNHKVVNSSLGLVLLLLEILSFILLAIIWKPMQIEQFSVKYRALIIFTKVMSNDKFYIKGYTEIDILIILPLVYYTSDRSHSPSLYLLYWRVMESAAMLSSDFSYNQFYTKINGASHRSHWL